MDPNIQSSRVIPASRTDPFESAVRSADSFERSARLRPKPRHIVTGSPPDGDEEESFQQIFSLHRHYPADTALRGFSFDIALVAGA